MGTTFVGGHLLGALASGNWPQFGGHLFPIEKDDTDFRFPVAVLRDMTAITLHPDPGNLFRKEDQPGTLEFQALPFSHDPTKSPVLKRDPVCTCREVPE